jgi:hypothetical protein
VPCALRKQGQDQTPKGRIASVPRIDRGFATVAPSSNHLLERRNVDDQGEVSVSQARAQAPNS